jgi:flagellar motor component MotA
VGVSMDNQTKLYLLATAIIGFFLGILLCYAFALGMIDVIGHAIKIESVNTTISINQSMIMDILEKMNQSRNS